MNKEKILVLENQSYVSQRLKSWLTSFGYEIETHFDSKNLDLNSNFILQNRFSLVLQISNSVNQFGASLMGLVEGEFPIPIVHVVEEAVFNPKKWLRTPHHDWANPNISQFEFLRKIQNMIYFCKKDRELFDIRYRIEQIEIFSSSLRRKRLHEVVDIGFELFKKEYGVKSLLWFQPGALKDELRRYSRIREKHPEVQAKDIELAPNWLSNLEFNHEDVFRLFEKWDIVEVEHALANVQKLEQGTVIAPLSIHGTQLGHVVMIDPENWQAVDETSEFTDYYKCFLHHLEQSYAYQQIEHMTFRDDLTELYNQRYLPIILEQEMQRAVRHGHHFSVLFLDVDFFKLVNDTKGHLVGSNVLVQISKLIKESIRGTDFAFRYGGDEYVIVLSDAASKEATIVAERLRKKTESSVFEVGDSQVKVTVSIGIATYPEHAKTTAELLQMADDAMYKGKHKSRNIVYLAS